MKHFTHIIALAFLATALLFATTNSAQAQRGGGSGGGGGSTSGGGSSNRHGGSFNLIFDRTSGVAGSRSTCIGGYNITTYVTTMSIDYRCRNLDLPDGTQIGAIVYTTDYFTGLPWLPIAAGNSTVTGGAAAFHNPNVITTGVNGLPVFQSIQLVLADGTVIFTGHP